MPHQHNADRRHHVPKMSFKVQNWPALKAKHGAKPSRTWRKLHLAVDAANGVIVVQTLSDQDTDDPSQVGRLLDQTDGPVGRVRAEGA